MATAAAAPAAQRHEIYLSVVFDIARLSREVANGLGRAPSRFSSHSSSSQLATIVGDPASARETVSRFKDVGVDELMLVMQMGTVPHELVCESIRTFAEEVMPHFA